MIGLIIKMFCLILIMSFWQILYTDNTIPELQPNIIMHCTSDTFEIPDSVVKGYSGWHGRIFLDCKCDYFKNDVLIEQISAKCIQMCSIDNCDTCIIYGGNTINGKFPMLSQLMEYEVRNRSSFEIVATDSSENEPNSHHHLDYVCCIRIKVK